MDILLTNDGGFFSENVHVMLPLEDNISLHYLFCLFNYLMVDGIFHIRSTKDYNCYNIIVLDVGMSSLFTMRDNNCRFR